MCKRTNFLFGADYASCAKRWQFGPGGERRGLDSLTDASERTNERTLSITHSHPDGAGAADLSTRTATTPMQRGFCSTHTNTPMDHPPTRLFN